MGRAKLGNAAPEQLLLTAQPITAAFVLCGVAKCHDYRSVLYHSVVLCSSEPVGWLSFAFFSQINSLYH